MLVVLLIWNKDVWVLAGGDRAGGVRTNSSDCVCAAAWARWEEIIFEIRRQIRLTYGSAFAKTVCHRDLLLRRVDHAKIG